MLKATTGANSGVEREALSPERHQSGRSRPRRLLKECGASDGLRSST